MSQTPCPNTQQLLDYVNGRLSDTESGSIEMHLDVCSTCLNLMGALLDADDPLRARLRRPVVPDPYEQEPGFQLVLARARAAVQMVVAGEDVPEESPPVRTAELREIGDYRLLGRLGQGGMGTVYRALQVKLEKIVALKVLPPGHTQDPRALARFEREMKAVGRLNHPNIVQALDAREIDGTSILVMEYVEGDDLARVVRHHGPLRVPDACELVRQAAVGLEYVHENDLVHRDIKPSNLMLNRAGQVKILDLGLALLQTGVKGKEMTGSEQAMGTADYVSPEQVQNAHYVDIRADIYSLGCTLYKLLAGRAPFGGPDYHSTFEKMLAHVRRAVPPIRDLRPDVAPELAAVLDRMLAKSADDRYAKPGDVARAIARFTIGCDLLALLGTGNRGTTVKQAGALSATAMAATDPVVSSALSGTAGGLGNAVVRLHDQTAPTMPAPSASQGAGLVSPEDLTTIAAGANVGYAAGESPLSRPAGATNASPLARQAGEGPGVRAPRVRRRLAIGLGVLGVALLFGVVLWINRTRIEVPDGSKVALNADGSVGIEPPEQKAEAKSPSYKPGPPLPKPKVVSIQIDPEPLPWKAGDPLSKMALVTNPAPIPGVRSWTIETAAHRDSAKVAYSPDGQVLATASMDGTIRLWDSASGKLMRVLLGHDAPVYNFAWSPDGRYLASGDFDAGTMRTWDANSGRLLRTYRNFCCMGVAWSPDGRTVAGGGFGEIRLFQTGRPPRALSARECSNVHSIAWSPDGKRLAAGGEPNVFGIWDAQSGVLLHMGKVPSVPDAVDWSPDGRIVATACDRDGLVFWDAETGQPAGGPSLLPGGGCRAIAWTPDRTVLTVGSSWNAVSYDWQTRREIHRWNTTPGDILVSVAYSPSGQRLAIGSRRGGVQIYHTETCAQTHHIPGHGTFWPLRDKPRFSPVGRAVALTDTERRVRVWEVGSCAFPYALEGADETRYQYLTHSLNGRAIAAWMRGDKNWARIWNCESRKCQASFSWPSPGLFASALDWTAAVALSPDGAILAVPGAENTELWDARSGKLLRRLAVHGNNLAWSPDGKILAAQIRNRIALCDPTNGAVLKTLSPTFLEAWAMAWSPDSKSLAVGRNDGRQGVSVWDIASGDVRHTFDTLSDGSVRSLRWMSDGKTLVAADYRIVFVWDTEVGKLVQRVEIGADDISPDGRLAMKGGASAIRLSSLPDGRTLTTLLCLRGGQFAFVSPDGHFRGTPGVEKQLVYVVQTDQGPETLTPEEFAKKYGWKNDSSKAWRAMEAAGSKSPDPGPLPTNLRSVPGKGTGAAGGVQPIPAKPQPAANRKPESTDGKKAESPRQDASET